MTVLSLAVDSSSQTFSPVCAKTRPIKAQPLSRSPLKVGLHCYSTFLLPLKGTNREWRGIVHSHHSPNFLFVQVFSLWGVIRSEPKHLLCIINKLSDVSADVLKMHKQYDH